MWLVLRIVAERFWELLRGCLARRGREAPDFELLPQGGGPPVRLSSFRGKRPVVLIFGSYS